MRKVVSLPESLSQGKMSLAVTNVELSGVRAGHMVDECVRDYSLTHS